MAHQEITAIYLREKHRFQNPDGDVIVGDIRFVDGPRPVSPFGDGEDFRSMQIKGPADEGQLKEGLPYRFFGRWGEYRGDPQFQFQTLVPAKPIGEEGIVSYLTRHGEGLGIGRRRAEMLWEKFGTEAVKACRERPEEAVTAVPNWRLDQATTLAGRLKKAEATEACTIELVELLQGRGFPKTTVQRAMSLWGNQAADVIRRNPYALMACRGCGFKRTDAMYLDLRLPPTKLKRQALCAWHALASDSSGHTWYPVEKCIQGIKQNVAGCAVRPGRSLVLAKRAGYLSFARTEDDLIVDEGGKLWAAERKCADHEQFIARSLAKAECEPHDWPDAASIVGISEHQRERLTTALGGIIGILGGGPGTGKTYSAASIILAVIAKHGLGNIAVAAPTGKAAVRISEALANYKIPLRASTIHSLLAYDPLVGGFTYKAGRPLPFRYIIIDEASMIDTDLMASLLAARAVGTHILFVGDIHQLPPVGHGAPLRDMIAAGLPYGELREIQRQAAGSMIVAACHAIREGKPYNALASLDEYDGRDKNLVRIEAANPQQQIDALQKALRWASENGFDPVWDCQVLAAVNAKSQLARKPLNKLLQAQLNTQSPIKGCPFKVGDKIVNTKNANFKLTEAVEGPEGTKVLEIRVANGDLAEVIEVADKFLLARLLVGNKVIRVPRGKAAEEDADEKSGDEGDDKGPSTGCSWDLAYALSTHKSQGSEWPLVIVMLDEYPGALRVASREWLYTADSRGKKLQIEIGKYETARKMCRKVALGDRKTLLKERINFEQCKLLAEAM